MNVTPYLDKNEADKHGRHKINIDVTWQGHRFREYTGERIKPKDWNDNKKLVKASEPMHVQINDAIADTVNKIKTVWYELRKQSSTVEKEAFKQAVKQARFPEKAARQSKTVTLSAFFDKFMRDYASQYSPSYLSNFVTVKEYLEAIDATLTPEDMSIEVMNQLIGHLHEADLSDNSISVYISKVQRVLKYAVLCGHKVPPSYQLVTSKIMDGDRIFLTEEELAVLHNARFEDPELDVTAGRFLLACYTGFRVSDLRRLADSIVEWENFQTIEMRQKKTLNPVRVALNDYALEVWSRYDGHLMDGFKEMDLRRYNTKIKEVALRCGINSETKITEVKRGDLIESVVPKYEALSSHSARHAFAVQSILRGMDIFTLRDILGHKNVTSTEKYAKIVETLRHERMLHHWKKN